MEIKVAKTAGFCFGVNRAVELTYGLLAEGRRVATLGPLIHNPQAVADMQAKGAFVADSVPQVPDGYEVVIRSHGVPRSVYDELEARGIAYHDATAPLCRRSSALPHRPKKRVPCCWWRAIRPTRRCRASWGTPAERCSFLPIWRSLRPGKAPRTRKNPFLQLHRPHFR